MGVMTCNPVVKKNEAIFAKDNPGATCCGQDSDETNVGSTAFRTPMFSIKKVWSNCIRFNAQSV